MIKKIAGMILIAVVSAAMLLSLSGCNTLSASEAYEAFRAAIEESLTGDNGKIFYWRESTAQLRPGSSNLVDEVSVNVLCDMNENYEFIREENAGEYDYENLKVHVVKTHDGNTTEEIWAGTAENGTDYIVRATDGGSRAFEAGTAYQFVETEEFNQNYSLRSRLEFLADIEEEDLIISSAEQQGNLLTITATMSDGYLAEHPDSDLDGKRVVIEITYGRIASVTTYKDEGGGGIFSLDYESYMLEIAYTGPIFTVPIYV